MIVLLLGMRMMVSADTNRSRQEGIMSSSEIKKCISISAHPYCSMFHAQSNNFGENSNDDHTNRNS